MRNEGLRNKNSANGLTRLNNVEIPLTVVQKIHNTYFVANAFTDTPAVQVPPSGDDVDTEAAAEKTVPKKGLKLSYDEYKQMANLLVCYMRKLEETAGGQYHMLKVTRL